ncbi:MAG: glycosyltransferase family 2 protein, partial [Actinobacteria bacterium]|nr:glycosyltransferase family 2 protein [Actinomycetota bacterium]NIS32074.1 glycosyltransferase family 2 protein [Actinomycetota bacterium]NIU67144.1 glycosyltransferase family 2 protein [Actinomycetota bacterium]NIW28923.1 glycosyltransferase family 2 protein [Actinomycetota bacterium]NIX21404.1 glycosyltransferase family 2 protein [Actinomycetota bacterium]
ELFGEPFVSRWLFDCEILLRAEALGAAVYEEPLAEWRDRGHESKVTPPAYLRSLRDLLRIRRRYRSG